MTRGWVVISGYSLLPPANVVCEGYVCTRVCHSVHRVPGQVHPPTPGTRYIPQNQVQPPGPGTPPLRPSKTPGPGTPLGTRYTPLDQVYPPGPGIPPPGTPTPCPPEPGTPTKFLHFFLHFLHFFPSFFLFFEIFNQLFHHLFTLPPRAVHAGRYGQEVGSTHPTGMHSYYCLQT